MANRRYVVCMDATGWSSTRIPHTINPFVMGGQDRLDIHFCIINIGRSRSGSALFNCCGQLFCLPTESARKQQRVDNLENLNLSLFCSYLN